MSIAARRPGFSRGADRRLFLNKLKCIGILTERRRDSTMAKGSGRPARQLGAGRGGGDPGNNNVCAAQHMEPIAPHPGNMCNPALKAAPIPASVTWLWPLCDHVSWNIGAAMRGKTALAPAVARVATAK
jgi:hypothetical protein